MPKSKYPEKIDTSVEIPAVRDNIAEVGSDVLNSIRTAIFQIERTLGINPQGAIGNSVAGRLSSSLDGNGNILKEALDRAGLISGPIIDSDVSKVASIQESKLKLNYPTQVLQSEISILNSQIDEIIEKIAEIAAQLSAHINKNALSRHTAIQIDVDSALVYQSDSSAKSLEEGNLQEALETIYNAHVNYTGLNVSESNNSHAADQIYYNKELTSDIITGNDVQTAIDEVANVGLTSLRNSILNLHSNGIIRSGSVVDDFGGIGRNNVVLDGSPVSYTFSTGSKTIVSLITATEPELEASLFDTVILSNSNDDDGDYAISRVNYAGDNITSVEIFGNLKSDSTETSYIKIVKNTYSLYNQNSLNCTVRTKADHTNTPDIQVANPNSATILSSGIRPENITVDNNSFDIVIDDKDPITIYTYSDSMIDQSLDSVITMINDQAVGSHLNFMAYKVKMPSCYEIALAHNLPNSSTDHKNRTLRVSYGSEKDAAEVLGFSGVIGVEFEGTSGNSYHINGYIYSDFGRITQLSADDIYFIGSSSRLSLISSSALDLGIRAGDIFVVSGSSDSSDDGTYRVAAISDTALFTDDPTNSWSGEVTDGTIIFIIRSTCGISEMTFEESVSSEGTILFDCFLDESKDLFFSRRLEVDGSIRGPGFVASVIDVSGSFILSKDIATLEVGMDGMATLTDPLGQVGEPVFIATDGEYNVYSADKMSFVTVNVFATAFPSSLASVDIYGYDEVSSDNLWLCRGTFGPTLGRVFGEDSVPGVPIVRDKRNSGTADKTIISKNIIEKYIEGPRNELRSSGVIRGCDVSLHNSESGVYDDGVTAYVYQEVDISSGIAYINGIRFEFLGQEAFRVNLEEDFYIGLNNEGCLVAEPDPEGDGYASSPFYSQIVAHLAFVHISDGIIEDLRFFVDHLDYKLVSDITVAEDQRFCHFTTLEKAVDYARRFTYLFPSMPTPTILIKEGTYEVKKQLLIDFDVKISGVGEQTVLRRDVSGGGEFSNGFDVECFTKLDHSLFLIGGGPSSSSERIINGVTLQDFRYESPGLAAGKVALMIGISQGADSSGTSKPPVFSIKNISFVGDESSDWGTTLSIPGPAGAFAGDAHATGETFLAYLQQVEGGTKGLNSGVNNIVLCSVEVINCDIYRPNPLCPTILFMSPTSGGTGGLPGRSSIIVRDNIVKFYMPSSMAGFPATWGHCDDTSSMQDSVLYLYGLWTYNFELRLPSVSPVQGVILYKDNIITSSV
jgi:hypothetical protein